MTDRHPQFFTTRIANWGDAKLLFERLRSGWVFRGQRDVAWGLTTSLERAVAQARLSAHYSRDCEKQILRLFKRAAHHHYPHPPAEDEPFEWLALLQHHGGPTRLLDFTHSLYVATFFAVEDAHGDAAVWAVNARQLESFGGIVTRQRKQSALADDRVPTLDELAQASLSDFGDTPLAVQISLCRLNERMLIQKGTFLFPCHADQSFESNLCSTFKFRFTTLAEEHSTRIRPDDAVAGKAEAMVLKIEVPEELHAFILCDLDSMNISAASLFPGLDGFARSLRTCVRELDERVPVAWRRECRDGQQDESTVPPEAAPGAASDVR